MTNAEIHSIIFSLLTSGYNYNGVIIKSSEINCKIIKKDDQVICNFLEPKPTVTITKILKFTAKINSITVTPTTIYVDPVGWPQIPIEFD